MRAAIPVLLAAGVIFGATGVPIAEARDCRVECYTVGCWPIPGGRRCRRTCERRCWGAPRSYHPRYVPAPTFQPVSYAPAAGLTLLLGGGVLAIAFTIAALLKRTAITEIHKQTEAAIRDTDDAGDLTRRARAVQAEIDQFIEARLADAYRGGRNSVQGQHHD